MKVQTAVQTTNNDINIELIRHQEDNRKWDTWDSFCEHMKHAYGSMETGLMKWIRLSQLTQKSEETVDTYYTRFRRCVSTQMNRMKHPDDIHIYNFMFIEGLQKEIRAEVLHLPEARTIEELKLQDTLELAKRAAQSAKLRSGDLGHATGGDATSQSHAGPIRKKGGKNGKSKDSRSHDERRGLTDGEKKFIKSNCERGGRLVVRKETRRKPE
jgi:hypothetical protein